MQECRRWQWRDKEDGMEARSPIADASYYLSDHTFGIG
jgi:hypothetical protein